MKKSDKMKKNIFKNVKPISLGLFFEKEKLLAIGDLHLGQEGELNSTGIFVPRSNFEKVEQELKLIFSETGKLNTIVFLGDVKHEFGSANNQEWREVVKLFEIAEKAADKVVVIRGNHDSFIKSIANWKKFKIFDTYEEGEYLFCHGNKIIESKKKKIIIGHEHSAIMLRDANKKEKYKCFAKTKFKNKDVVVLPSFNFLTTGTDLLREKLISNYLKESEEFEFWVIEERKIFYFGKMKRQN